MRRLRLHAPLAKTVLAAVLPWVALVYLYLGFSIWPASISQILWFALGAAYTHVFEYGYHRWFMHRLPGFVRTKHLMHHRIFHGEHFATRDERVLKHVTGQRFLFPSALVAHYFLLRSLLSAPQLSSFLSGVVLHYLLFEITHWFAHVADNGFDRVVARIPLVAWMREMQLRHHRFHHEMPEVNFNFNPPFAMDFLWSTFSVPGDCAEGSVRPCFEPETLFLRTPFDADGSSPSPDVGASSPSYRL